MLDAGEAFYVEGWKVKRFIAAFEVLGYRIWKNTLSLTDAWKFYTRTYRDILRSHNVLGNLSHREYVNAGADSDYYNLESVWLVNHPKAVFTNKSKILNWLWRAKKWTTENVFYWSDSKGDDITSKLETMSIPTNELITYDQFVSVRTAYNANPWEYTTYTPRRAVSIATAWGPSYSYTKQQNTYYGTSTRDILSSLVRDKEGSTSDFRSKSDYIKWWEDNWKEYCWDIPEPHVMERCIPEGTPAAKPEGVDFIKVEPTAERLPEQCTFTVSYTHLTLPTT